MSKLLPILIIVVAALAGGGGGFFLKSMTSTDAAEPAPAEDSHAEPAEKHEKKSKGGMANPARAFQPTSNSKGNLWFR